MKSDTWTPFQGRIHVWSESAPPPPLWQINHANSAYFRLFLGYFQVISATWPPFWISPHPPFLHILDPPLHAFRYFEVCKIDLYMWKSEKWMKILLSFLNIDLMNFPYCVVNRVNWREMCSFCDSRIVTLNCIRGGGTMVPNIWFFGSRILTPQYFGLIIFVIA